MLGARGGSTVLSVLSVLHLPGHHHDVFPPQEELGRVSHTDLDFPLDFDDPEHALPHLELPLLPGPGPGPWLRPSRHCHLPRPPPGELLVHIRECEVPVLR